MRNERFSAGCAAFPLPVVGCARTTSGGILQIGNKMRNRFSLPLVFALLIGCRSASSEHAGTSAGALNDIGAVASRQCFGLGRVDIWPDNSANVEPTQATLPAQNVNQVTGNLLGSDPSGSETWSDFVGERDAPPSTFFSPQDSLVLSADLTQYRFARAPRNGATVPDVVNHCVDAETFSDPQSAHESTCATQAEWDAFPVTPDPATSSEWVLTFHDEFDGSTLSSAWNTRYFRSTAWTALDQGILHLKFDDTRPDFAFNDIRISSISTEDSFSQTYGWFEIRAKFPNGSGFDRTGIACSFWTQPLDTRYNDLVLNGGNRNNGWESYEIDIFEDNSQTSHAGSNGGDPLHLSEGRFFNYPWAPTGGSDASRFHVYAVEWSPTLLTWYVDGKVVFTSALVPQSPMWFYIQARTQASPAGTFANGPLSLDIDYFRAYRRAH
jgi:beta-glucanase (GH16 family)